MKYKSKNTVFNCLFVAGLLAISLNSTGQKTAVMADPKLGVIKVSDLSGNLLDASNLKADQLIKITIPVSSESHGKAVPSGSCKIKIGRGSKLELDPQFDLNNSGLGSYFRWTSSVNSGQVQIAGDLTSSLPADLKSVELAFRVKGVKEGKSTITSNFLITNHNTPTILSDENGANNAASLSYIIGKKLDLISSVPDGSLQMSVYPNPAKNVRNVMIKLDQGRLNGKYMISLMDNTGTLISSKAMNLSFANSLSYDLGNIPAGQYLIKVLNTDGTQSKVMKIIKN